MAKKGQKFKKYSDEIKQQIILDLHKGISHKYISKKYNIPLGTIDTWASKLYYPVNYPGYGQKRGRPKATNLTKEDWKERYEILKKYQAFLKAQRERK